MEFMKVKIKAITQQYHVKILSKNNFKPRFAISVHFALLPLLLCELSFRCKRKKEKKEKTFWLNLPMQKNNAKMALTALTTFPLQHNIANVRVSVVWYTKKKSNILWDQNILEATFEYHLLQNGWLNKCLPGVPE